MGGALENTWSEKMTGRYGGRAALLLKLQAIRVVQRCPSNEMSPCTPAVQKICLYAGKENRTTRLEFYSGKLKYL